MSREEKNILEFDHISKTFPGVLALDQVSFGIRKGEVHGLVGENGAGKSTLIKILCGIYHADEGQILIDGKPVHIGNPEQSQEYGVHVMHQEISVLPNMTVAENMNIQSLPRKGKIFTDKKAMLEKTRKALETAGLHYVEPNGNISRYSLATQQMIHLARIISMEPKVVLLDEPTASLTMNEAQQLFAAIEKFKSMGVSIIYISHYLDEVLKICDRITVLRDGKYMNTYISEDTDNEEIVTAMVGKKVTARQREALEHGETVLEIKNLTTASVVRHASLKLHRNEVLGLYGLNGAGKTELLRGIGGIDRILQGDVFIQGEKAEKHDIQSRLEQGIVYAPEDRRRLGLVLGMSVLENVSLGNERNYASMQMVDFRAEREDAVKYIEKMRIKTPTAQTQVGVLSGGNQQKVVLARCMAGKNRIFLLDEPTVGIDVGAREEIYSLISEIVQSGSSVLLASSDLNEILEVSDRIAVIAHGTIVKVLDRKEAAEETLLLYAMGDESHE
ncbi:MAG: sugar ABC transporter ATP-binding protein [Eubacteriales bacterium]|nr:sugar ABC transporter ATP-binding protein [Eubacteriales bacterium]